MAGAKLSIPFSTVSVIVMVPQNFLQYNEAIATFEKKECDKMISFDDINLGNRCLYCDYPCGGMRGEKVKHCKRKMSDSECSSTGILAIYCITTNPFILSFIGQ